MKSKAAQKKTNKILKSKEVLRKKKKVLKRRMLSRYLLLRFPKVKKIRKIKKSNEKKWLTFLNPERGAVLTGKAKNKYSRLLEIVQKKHRYKSTAMLHHDQERHQLTFRAVSDLVRLPFFRREPKKASFLERFINSRAHRKLSLKNTVFNFKKIKHSLFFLRSRQKQFKRRSPRSLSRKFFTNI